MTKDTWAERKTKQLNDAYNKCIVEVNRMWNKGEISTSLYADEIVICDFERNQGKTINKPEPAFKDVSLPTNETKGVVIGRIGPASVKQKGPADSKLVMLLLSTIIIGFVVAALIPRVFK